jgi:hypothetical protein
MKKGKDKLNLKSVDRAVYVLTNRTGNFSSGLFDENFGFKSWDTPSDIWLSIQKNLMLDKLSTDYYILVALSILETNKGIYNKIPNYVPSFNIRNFPNFVSRVNGGEIINYGNYNSNFKKHTQPFPIPSKYTLVCTQDGKTVTIHTEDKEIGSILPKIVNRYGTNKDPNSYAILSGNWEEYIPFEGSIKTQGNWHAGSQISIEYMPKSIDYKAWVNHLCRDTRYEDFLNKVGLLETFRLARQDTEKLAIFYLAMIKHWDLENN